jgi:hypothetical protein
MEPSGIVSKGERLILTAGDANGHAMLSVSADLMARYALKVGADFKIINQQNHSGKPLPRPHAVKFYMASQPCMLRSESKHTIASGWSGCAAPSRGRHGRRSASR